MTTNNSQYHPRNEMYKGDAPNEGDMELIRENLERVLKTQEDYWKWKNNQENLEGTGYWKWNLGETA